MSEILSYEKFFSVSEKEEKKKASAPTPERVESVDTSGGTIKDVEINGKQYVAVLSTYKAIADKQAAMGRDAVGMYTIPGSELVYELMKKDDKENEE